METLVLLLFLQVKHWYADFKIQTYQQTVKKGILGDRVGISHSVDHVWATLIACMLYGIFYTISPLVILIVALVEGVVHYIIDYTKVKYGCKDNTKPLFWNQFGLDQLAHQICYILMCYILVLT